jgi:hypothetical protein
MTPNGFRLTLTAATFEELKNKIIETYNGLAPIEQIQTPVRAAAASSDGDEVTEEEFHSNVAPGPAPGPDESDDLSSMPIEETPTGPITLPSPPPAIVGLPELDAQGLPWDERIHASSKTLTTRGTWRTRRNLADGYQAQVEAELRSKLSGRAPVAAPAHPIPQPPVAVASQPVPPPPVATVAAPEIPQAPVAAPPVVVPFVPPTPYPPSFPASQAPVVAPAVPAAPQSATPPSYGDNIAPPVAAQKPAHTLDSFRSNMIMALAQLVSNKSIDQAYIDSLKQYFGVKEVWHIAGDEAKSRELFDQLVAYGMITKVG